MVPTAPPANRTPTDTTSSTARPAWPTLPVIADDLHDRLAAQPQQRVDVVDAEPAEDAAAAPRPRSNSRLAGSRTATDEVAKLASAATSRPSSPAAIEVARRPGRRRVAAGQPDHDAHAARPHGRRRRTQLRRRPGGRLVDDQVDAGLGQARDGGRRVRVGQRDQREVQVVIGDQPLEARLERHVAIRLAEPGPQRRVVVERRQRPATLRIRVVEGDDLELVGEALQRLHPARDVVLGQTDDADAQPSIGRPGRRGRAVVGGHHRAAGATSSSRTQPSGWHGLLTIRIDTRYGPLGILGACCGADREAGRRAEAVSRRRPDRSAGTPASPRWSRGWPASPGGRASGSSSPMRSAMTGFGQHRRQVGQAAHDPAERDRARSRRRATRSHGVSRSNVGW